MKSIHFASALSEDTKAKAAQLETQPATFAPELQNLLNALTPINFREAAESSGLAPDEKLTQKIVLVVAIREALRQIQEQGAGLTSSNGLQYVYAGGYWHEIPADEMKAFLTAAAIRLGMKPNEAQHFESQDNLYRQFQVTARLAQPYRCPDSVLINFKNGTLEIRGKKLELRQARPADFLKYQLPYNYDPGASCPQFIKYLNRVLPDDSAQKVLAEFVGNTLAPSLNLQKALVLQGGGCNGKSVFCDIVTAVLGRDNVSAYTMESLTKQDSRSRAQLENKLLNYSGENSIKLGVEAFKTLVRGEPIEARRLYQESYTIEHYARLMFNCNLLPRDIEQTEGFFRSFLIIPFKVRISEAEKDPQLAAKIIAEELPGVFNWILEGLKRILKSRKYTDCEAARLELENYRKESNSVLMFIEECSLKPAQDTKHKMMLSELYSRYTYFCSESGFFKQNKNTFSKSLRSAGFNVGKINKGMAVFATDSNVTSAQLSDDDIL